MQGVFRRGAAAAGMVVAMLLLGGGAGGAQLSRGTPPVVSTAPSSPAGGLTVSWPPTSAPVSSRPGTTTASRFWITNPTDRNVSVTINPAIAVPGDNGHLAVQSGTNAAFPEVHFSPRAAVIPAHKSIVVRVTTTVGSSLGPGVYLLPAVVQPHYPPGVGNIRIAQRIVALTTFQVPGATNARATAVFLLPASGRRVIVRTVGHLTVEIASSGSATLQVLDASQSSLYAYTETTVTQSPFGSATFSRHTPGESSDLRTPSALYFPGKYRNFPLAWSAHPVGIGLASLHAFVGYSPGPGRLVSIATSARVLVVTPWWAYVPLAVTLVCLLFLRRRIRRRRSFPPAADPGVARITSRIASSLVAVAVIAVLAAFARPLALIVCCGPSGLLAIAVVVLGRGRLASHRLATAAQLLAGLLLVGGAASVALGARAVVPIDAALAAVAGAGTATLVTWWTSWVIRQRSEPRHLRGRAKSPDAAGVGA